MMIAVDFNNRGHHPSYLIKLKEAGWSGRIVTSAAANERVRQNIQLSVDRSGTIEAVALPPEGFREQVRWMDRHLTDADSIHLAIDDLFVAMVTRPSFWLGRGARWSGLWMSSNFFYRRKESLKYRLQWMLFRLFLWREARVFRRQHRGKIIFLNEELAEYLGRSLRLRPWVGWCPDPPDEYYRQPRDYVRVTRTVLFFGEHTARKGTEWALDALREWEGDGITVVIAGEWKGINSLSSLAAGLPDTVRLVERSGYLSQEEVADVFCSADAVALPYRWFGGSSGVYNTAVASGLSVVVPDFGLLASRCRRYNVGEIFPHDSKSGFRAAVARALMKPARERSRAGGAQFARDNGPAAFCAALESSMFITGVGGEGHEDSQQTS